MLKTDAIKLFLKLKTHPELAAMYSADMEVQVNVNKGTGVAEDGEYKGKRWIGYTDGVTRWKPFRIPWNANTDPTYDDKPIGFDMILHTEGVGMTGWDWKNRVSRWVAFDFDALIGHSEAHAKKLTADELQQIEEIVRGVDWVTLRKSTSGRGLHLYVTIKEVQTHNHNEHAALARAILSQLSGLTGFDFDSKVDICGGNMWVWHRKMSGTDGLKLIKQGTVLEAIPENWREHIRIIARKTKRVVPSNIEDTNKVDDFNDLVDQRTRVPLDNDHKRLLKYLEDHKCRWWWDRDNHMFVAHTFDLLQAHTTLKLAGVYTTISTGREQGNDHNCFGFPIRNGGWSVRRYGERTAESVTWAIDSKKWTKCYLNKTPDLATLARQYGAVELEKGGYIFKNGEDAKNALTHYKISFELPIGVQGRKMVAKELVGRDKIVLSFAHESSDDGSKLDGWNHEKGNWKRVFAFFAPNKVRESVEFENYDERIRHITSSGGGDLGWMLSVAGKWREEPLTHIRLALNDLELATKDVNTILGEAINNGWCMVNKPFQSEYPGNREWNRNTARFRCLPTADLDSLTFPTWKLLYEHCGKNLTDSITEHEWCKQNGIRNGFEYLMLWFASLIQNPTKPLPYVFFWGPQNSGKSSIHEMFTEFIVENAHMQAKAALTSDGKFNAELESSILCIVEEVDLRKNNSEAYNLIKDWVTSPQILVHPKGKTPYQVTNYTHWIQVGNERSYCPIFPGDTRIVMCRVDLPEKEIPKDRLRILLAKEAPDFLAHLLSLEIPDSEQRLALPVISTPDKLDAENANMSSLEHYIKEKGFEKQGHYVTAAEFIAHFHEWLPVEEIPQWNKIRLGTKLAALGRYPKGRITGGVDIHYGNLSLDPEAQPKEYSLIAQNNYLIPYRIKKVLDGVRTEATNNVETSNVRPT